MELSMKNIRIKRPVENFNKEVKYAVLINGEKITELSNGEEKTLQLTAEAEVLEAHIRSGSSEKFSVAAISDNTTIEVSGEKWRNAYGKYAGALIPLIGLSIVLNDKYPMLEIAGGIVLLLYIFLLIYMLGFQKRKWLRLRVID